MQFLVHAEDGDDSGDRLETLAEAHWAYMDRHTGVLVARGPTLTADGSAHTGSVHVVDASGVDEARRFAAEEPYRLAGLYGSVTITRLLNTLDGTMWDRPPAAVETSSALVLATWPAEPRASHGPGRGWTTLARIREQTSLVFGGLLVSDDASTSAGAVLAVDADLVEADRIAATVFADRGGTSVLTQRWRRGGRPER